MEAPVKQRTHAHILSALRRLPGLVERSCYSITDVSCCEREGKGEEGEEEDWGEGGRGGRGGGGRKKGKEEEGWELEGDEVKEGRGRGEGRKSEGGGERRR